MALHTLVGLALGWRYPSAPVFLAGALAIAWATVAPRQPPRVVGALGGLALFAPSVLPLTLLVATLAAFAVIVLPGRPDPLANLAIALPALTILALALTLSPP
jgi:hypothetical protein